MRKVSKTLCNSLRWAALDRGLFAILVDLTPVPNFYLIINEKSFNNSSTSHFGDLVILVDLTPVPDIKFQNPQQGTWLVCRRGWFGILFLRSLIGWSRSSFEHRSRPLNKKVSKNPFWISSNISLLELTWLEKCLKTLNFWLAGNLFSKTEKLNVIDQLENLHPHTSPILHQGRCSTIPRNVYNQMANAHWRKLAKKENRSTQFGKHFLENLVFSSEICYWGFWVKWENFFWFGEQVFSLPLVRNLTNCAELCFRTSLSPS